MNAKSGKISIKFSWILIIVAILFLGIVGSLFQEDEKENGNINTEAGYAAEATATADAEGAKKTTEVQDSITTPKPTKETEISPTEEPKITKKSNLSKAKTVKLSDIPEYSGKPYVAINDNVPFFKKSELKKSSYEKYSKLDSLGRCGVVSACIGKDLMPTEERGSIGHIRPTGWHTVKYDVVDGKYLYNRCHLIGFQLTGENDNEKNLLTGTRSMNVDGMLPFENMVADYVKETGNHVMYRVTPMFKGKNLLAKGVLLEAKSVEDNGDGILFNVFVYNVQDGVKIDYATGTSQLKGKASTEKKNTTKSQKSSSANNSSNSKNDVWISETGSKYHSYNSCGTMNPDKAYKMSEKNAKQQGYSACQRCY